VRPTSESEQAAAYEQLAEARAPIAEEVLTVLSGISPTHHIHGVDKTGLDKDWLDAQPANVGATFARLLDAVVALHQARVDSMSALGRSFSERATELQSTLLRNEASAPRCLSSQRQTLEVASAVPEFGTLVRAVEHLSKCPNREKLPAEVAQNLHDVNKCCEDWMSWLHVACARADDELVEALLWGFGVDPNKAERLNGRTVLHDAVEADI